MRRIGIYCGAFDPIHLGHLRVMRDVLSRDMVDEILIVPNAAPPYRKPVAPMADVRGMVALAIAGMNKVALIDEDLLKPGMDSLDSLKAIMRLYPDASFSYIMVADKLAGLLHWPKAGKLLSLVDLIVYPRVGYHAHDVTLFAMAQGVKAQLLPVAPLQPSSHLVRSQLQALSDAPGMLDPRIAHYIALRGLYLPPYRRQVKGMMSPARFAHTLGVWQLAVDLAYRYQVGMQKAAVAALLHDCAKAMKLSQLQAIAKQYDLTRDPELLHSNALLHGRVGAKLAQIKFQVQDEDVLNAIRYHTTGRSHMSPLELCLYVADAAEAGRADYPGLAELRSLMWVDLRRAALMSMAATLRYVEDSGHTACRITQQAMEDLTRSTARYEAG